MKLNVKPYLLAALLTLAAFAPAQADKYPSKPIDIIVAFSAGGSTDLAARVLAGALQDKWKVPVRVVNMPGGNAVPAGDYVMRSAPDGTVILMDSQSQSSLIDIVVPKLPFDVSNRTYLGVAVQTPNMFIVPYKSPFKTMRDASEALKKDPSKISWTSLGGVGSPDFAFRRWLDSIGVDVTKTRAIQLKGASQSATMTAGGHVDIGISAWAGNHVAYESKLIRILATASPERFPQAPDVPTVAEAGYPKAETMYWLGFSGPPGMPADVAKAWKEAIPEMLKDKRVVDRLAKVGLVPFYKTPEEMKQIIAKEKVDAKRLWK
jgi:tripartite-type tricarboxylate transporter receptor subunit TctC